MHIHKTIKLNARSN